MDTSAVAHIVSNLNHCAAGSLECQTLEFKGWCHDEKDLSKEVSEAAVCLANAEGGLVIVGVDDKKVGHSAISRCPYPVINNDWIRSRIQQLTKPPVTCQVVRLGELLGNVSGTPLADLFIIEVSKTTYPSGHRTSRGVSLVRADRECRTEYLVENDDYSAVELEHLSCNALDDNSLRAAVANRERKFPLVKQLGHRPVDHLCETGLVEHKKGAVTSQSETFTPSIASLLLFGKEERIRAEFYVAETVVAIEMPTTAPLTSSNWYNVVESLTRFLPLIKDQLGKKQMEIPNEILTELLLNAYIHRCYRTPGPLQIRIRDNEVEIQNPGGLLGGLTSGTLIYAPPIYRNFKLADAARQFGYCEKAGAGIDKVYALSIASGLEFPVFHSAGNAFTAIIKTKPDEAFAKFMKDCAGDLSLSLPEMIVIRALRTWGEADIKQLAEFAQRPLDYMDILLRDLRRRSILDQTRERFTLSDSVLNQMGQYVDRRQMQLPGIN